MERASGTREVRVVTLNVWERQGAWDERRSVLGDGLRELQPDIVVFQEAVVTEEYDQVADLLGPSYHIAHQADREAGGSGLSIASRWEMREVWQEIVGRIAVAEIMAPLPLGTLFVAHHNPSWQLGFEHERERQALAASRLVEDLLGEREVSHAVLAGDFNATPDAASVRFWRGLQSLGDTSVCYRDAWESAHPEDPGHTFSPRNPLVTRSDNWPLELGRRIDYVMIRCGENGPTLVVAACERIFDEPVDGVWASDHFGVVADLAIPGLSSMARHRRAG